MYIDDCLKGTQLILAQRHRGAAQSRQRRVVTINQLVDIVEEIAGIS